MRSTFACSLTSFLFVLSITACGSVSTKPDIDGGGTEPEPDAADTGGEDCFNGTDDNENGTADCADPSCGAVATCVPVADPFSAGTLVAADEPCPAGFEGGETEVNQGLQPGECAGCGCTIGETSCVGTVWLYGSANDCAGDIGLSGGTMIGLDITFTCPMQPIQDGFVYGMRAEIDATQTCTASGTAQPEAATWARTMKFCRASQIGGGCAADQACVRIRPSAEQCALAEGPAACDGYGSVEADWYTGVDDTRSCGGCFCEAVGGNCDAVAVGLGSDWSCTDDPAVGDGEKVCIQRYSPPARLVGTATQPTGCTAEAPLSGSLDPRGQSTLCCSP